MSSIHNQDQIEAFFAGRANPAFRKRVGIRGPDRSGDNVDAFGLKNRIKGWAERAVIVMDQEAQGLFSVGKFPNQLPGLLSNPDLIGFDGDTSKMDAARPQFNEEKHVYGLKFSIPLCSLLIQAYQILELLILMFSHNFRHSRLHLFLY